MRRIIYRENTDLQQIERDFRTIKQAHFELRPIFVRKEARIRGHVFVTMLALLMQRRLGKYWKDLNITIKEGLDELSAASPKLDIKKFL